MHDTTSLPPFAKASLKARIDKFLFYLEKNRGRSRLTKRVYLIALNQALDLAIVNESRKMIDFMPFREAIASQKPKTIAKKVSAVRSFLHYLESEGLRFHAQALNSAKVPKSLPKPASHKQILETIAAIGGEKALMIELIYGLGLRIEEARTIEIKNIGDRFVRVTGKGSKTREVPIMPELKEKIDRHIAAAAPLKFLFEAKGEPLSDNQLRYRISGSFEGVGLKVTPHQLRHAFATEMLNGGAGIADVSEILGHSQLATTEIYTKLSTSAKLKGYLQAHPLCKGGKS